MKKIITLLMIGMVFTSCEKSDLVLPNPNEPTVVSLKTEEGLLAFSKGLYSKGLSSTYVISRQLHSYMGDELYSPYGNWGWRWAEQVTSITMPDGTVLSNPIGPEQKPQLQSTNSRTAGELNVFQYEWEAMNLLNITCNTILKATETTPFSGDAATKKHALKAWAYWWKGFAYSHIGSIYVSGIINDEAGSGLTNGNFVTNTAIIAESNSNFEKAKTELAAITAGNYSTYNEIIDKIVPDFCDRDNRVSVPMWIRQINSYKARNLMANKKVAVMTNSDWTAIISLANTGVQAGDNNFHIGMNANATNDLAGGFFDPGTLLGSGQQYCFVSERLVQEYGAGDERFTNNFYTLPSPNLRNTRGYNFGTRWGAIQIEDDGKFATSANLGYMEMGVTYEENQLDISEAKIRTGDIEDGLQILDAIRTLQGANVAATAGTGKTQAQAIKELMRERRVALFMRGTAFYDARRWGVTQSIATGGGRTDAVVYLPKTLLGTASAEVRTCTIDYNFMDYFDIPLNELDFNTPATGSATVKQ